MMDSMSDASLFPEPDAPERFSSPSIDPEPEDDRPSPAAPLADRIRARTLAEFVGQEEIVGPGTVLRRAIETDALSSMILWGPPGSGKTTLARVIARMTGAAFVSFSAVTGGVKEVREVIAAADRRLKRDRRRTILFVDEIHRFNRGQQDAFLPWVESGTIILIGATTENPSFEVVSALLSRARVFVLKPLSVENIAALMDRALAEPERGLAEYRPALDPAARDFIISMANGDARVALSALELAVLTTPPDAEGLRRVTLAIAQDALQRKHLLYDKSGEQHYDLISALHKSLRGSDAQAALYWMARMLAGGEDPLYITRRLMRFASEDVGLADPNALVQAAAVMQAVDFIGMPECDNALAQLVVYLAAAPKSNRLYTAIGAANRAVKDFPAEGPPLHIRNAPTRLMSDLGYGKGYQYDHDVEGHVSGQSFLPEALAGQVFYTPGDMGFEKEIAKRLDYWEKLRAEARKRKPEGKSE
jgi:putative ATPase